MNTKETKARKTAAPVRRNAVLRSEKIEPCHLQRLAFIYVRQSRPQQVVRHPESTRVQYALKDWSLDLGWPEDRILVIDDDLGKQGSCSENRPGFQRIAAEVSLDHVGIIFGVDMSRLARSCKDWYQLMDNCGMFRTLIADLDGIYRPWDYNDRLSLGLKGIMAEADIHRIKNLMLEARLEKAKRCELFFHVPTGYVRSPSGEVRFDPDEGVQEVVKVIFRKFEELGTLNALLRYLVSNRIQIGIRPHFGPNRGQLEWRRPNRMTLQNILKNPLYAGAYTHGRRPIDPRRQKPGRPGTGRTVINNLEECKVFKKDAGLPAYISWDQYQANIARLQANRCVAQSASSPRRGPALLSGLLMCGRCHRRMAVHYQAGTDSYRYACYRNVIDYGEPGCQSLSGKALDAFVEKWALEVLAPASLELSLQASTNIERERKEADRLWEQRLERAKYEADRARRQYNLCEPEYRLAARQLEREWDENLCELRDLQEEYDRFRLEKPKYLTAAEKEEIQRLADDIPALWKDGRTLSETKKVILRELIESVVVTVIGESEKVHLIINWAGGQETETQMTRPVARLEQLSYYPELRHRMQQLATEGKTAREIAERLNSEGFRPPRRKETFGPLGVLALMRREGIVPKGHHSGREDSFKKRLRPGEWTVPMLARELDMPRITLYFWKKRGWIRTRMAKVGGQRRVVLLADSAELERLRSLRALPRGYHNRKRWTGEADESKASHVRISAKKS
ncbi:MAG: recombinase family protein [Planctomycetota bacterium]|jgi:DNA invertase Pin-like site-specific DNA recombinase